MKYSLSGSRVDAFTRRYAKLGGKAVGKYEIYSTPLNDSSEVSFFGLPVAENDDVTYSYAGLN